MYIGSAAFQTANSKPIQKQRITGTVDSSPFTAANILFGSLSITNQCSDSTDTKIGAVYIGKLMCTFLPNFIIPVSSWKNRKITVNFGLCIDEEHNIWEDFKLGEFFVSEANITLNGISVTAYDAMAKFDKLLPSSYIIAGQAAEIARAMCEACNVSLGMTDLEIAQLPNGTRPLGLYTPNDCTTYRDVIYWLSATLGGFATIDRSGKLVFRAYENVPLPTEIIDDTKRVTGARFSDFATDFGSIVFDNDDGTSQRIGGMGVGATYYAGFNPFAQYGTPEARTVIRTNIFLSVQSMRYTPFNVSLTSSPIYELGDPIEFTGGIVLGNQKVGVVQSITYKAGSGVQISGFGQDPALQDVQSASERANSAANRAQANSEMIYRDYMNLLPISVEDGADAVKVVEINFTTNKKTDVEVWHEFQLLPSLVDPSMEVTAIYYMDGEEVGRRPVETYSDNGKHILGLHYFQNVEETGTHKWEVFLETDGGDLLIDQFGAIAVLKGQGLSKVDAWTGVIVLDDDLVAPDRIISLGSFTEVLSVSAKLLDHDIEVSDQLVAPFVTIRLGMLTEGVNIIFYRPTFNITTEDGDYNFITEDGDYNIVTD